MRPLNWSLLLLCFGPLLFVLWCLVSPPLYSYHPFHPNYSHLPSSYVDSGDRLSRFSPSFLLSSAIVPLSYVEGWYLKLRSAEGRHLALIYMYFVSADPNNSTAAITLLDSHNERSHLYLAPIEQFKSSPLPGVSQSIRYLLHSTHPPSASSSAFSSSPYHDFELHIGNNTMSPHAVTATLRSDGQSEAWVSADVNLTMKRALTASPSLSPHYEDSPWSTVFSPASHTVGLFAFLPLACYQQVIEQQLAVNGHISIGDEQIEFDGASGYYEKTRGSTFPDNYLWIHASHFTQSAPVLSSFFFSLASVPILPTSLRLPGFVCSFVLDGRSSHFATQLGSVLTSLTIDEQLVEFVLYDQHFTTRVAVTVSRHSAPIEKQSWLWAARNGQLRRVIPQRIGKDTVHVTVQHVTAEVERHSPSNVSGSPTERSTGGRTGVDLDAQSFSSRGYSLSSVMSGSSGSVGLEVFVHESELQRQVAVMYADVRPWLRERYFPIRTPLVSFSLSDTFMRSLLPDAISGITERLGVRYTLLAGCMLVLAAVSTTLLALLLVFARRRKPKLKAE